MKTLLIALAAAIVGTSAAAAPLVRVPPIIAPNSGPNLADYPVLVSCPMTTNMDVTPNAVPPGWSTYGMEPQFESTDIANFMGKDELHCNYAVPMHPNARATTLRLPVEEKACIKGPEREAFHCKAGTPH